MVRLRLTGNTVPVKSALLPVTMRVNILFGPLGVITRAARAPFSLADACFDRYKALTSTAKVPSQSLRRALTGRGRSSWRCVPRHDVVRPRIDRHTGRGGSMRSSCRITGLLFVSCVLWIPPAGARDRGGAAARGRHACPGSIDVPLHLRLAAPERAI